MKQMLKRLFQRSRRTLSSQQAYERWSVTYAAEPHNKLMEIEQAAMLELLPDLTACRVLDVACGTGRYMQLAQTQGAQKSIGVDNSIAMLKQAAGESVVCATSEALPLASASVEVVLCGLALGHVPRLQPSMTEISRVLVVGGVALISDFHPFQYLRGARRTFSADGDVYEVEHYPHLYADYHTAADRAGLRICAVREPLYDDMPVVLVIKVEKVAS